MASSHCRGSAEPKTFHLVNFVGPMWGIMACMALLMRNFRDEIRQSLFVCPGRESQKLRLKSLARREYPMTPGVARNCSESVTRSEGNRESRGTCSVAGKTEERSTRGSCLASRTLSKGNP